MAVEIACFVIIKWLIINLRPYVTKQNLSYACTYIFLCVNRFRSLTSLKVFTICFSILTMSPTATPIEETSSTTSSPLPTSSLITKMSTLSLSSSPSTTAPRSWKKLVSYAGLLINKRFFIYCKLMHDEGAAVNRGQAEGQWDYVAVVFPTELSLVKLWDHMTSNNETFHRQWNIWAGNIWKSMMSKGNCVLLSARLSAREISFHTAGYLTNHLKAGTSVMVNFVSLESQSSSQLHLGKQN